MPGIEFLKNWDLKKHGWPALVVLAVWATTELSGVFADKDPSCVQEVKFLQGELSTVYKDLRNEANENRQDKIIIKTLLDDKRSADSLLRAKTQRPLKVILNSRTK